MKFKSHKYWKQRGDCCDFIEVLEVLSDDGATANLRIALHTQFDKGWRTLVGDFEHRIGKRQYLGWNQFSPRGGKLE